MLAGWMCCGSCCWVCSTSLGVTGGPEWIILQLAASDGSFVWWQAFGNSNYVSPGGIAVAANGDIIVVGSIALSTINLAVARFSSSGTLLWAKAWNGQSNGYGVTLLPSGDILAIGSAGTFGAGNSDLALLGLAADGTACSLGSSIALLDESSMARPAGAFIATITVSGTTSGLPGSFNTPSAALVATTLQVTRGSLTGISSTSPALALLEVGTLS